MTTILIAVKELLHAKTRLAGVLPQQARQDLVLAMLEDLLSSLGQVAAGPIRVIASDARVRDMAMRHDADFQIETEPKSHNAAVRQGLSRVSHGPVAILPADLPAASAADLAAFLAPFGSEHAAVRIAPDRWRKGTNGLLLSAPDLVSPCFGVGSLAAHSQQSREAGAQLEVMARPGLGLDIDLPKDVLRARRMAVGGATGALLATERFTHFLKEFERGAA